MLRAATEANPTSTIVSIDGVGTYDHVSRRSMLQGMMADPELAGALPYVRQFYGTPSEYLWYNAEGQAVTVL